MSITVILLLFIVGSKTLALKMLASLWLGFHLRGKVGHWFNDLTMTQIAGQKWERFMEHWAQRTIEAEKKRREAEPVIPQASIYVRTPLPPQVWKKLIKLTHPDRHRGSELSTEVTAWLLEHRPK